MSKWRYQPVIVTGADPSDVTVSLCEVHFNDSDELTGWTENPDLSPSGDDIRQLQGELCSMLIDAWCWEPVPFADLTVGMKFKSLVTMAQREALGKMIQAAAHNLGQAIEERTE